ncbi:MAG TPA: hypothetical protein VL242_13985, partial [Sorangium sp.]|nr:hypothetical protein [Sorangium sp.]
EGLARALAAAHQRPFATLIEAVVPPHDGAARVARLWSDVRREIAASSSAPAAEASADLQPS